jgi:hypothetical protein
LGITGIPSQVLDGFPDGICKTDAGAVSVAGTGVLVGGIVAVLVGSGLGVDVGRLVLVGLGVSVGFGANVLQDANVTSRTVSRIAVMIVFSDFLIAALMFLGKHPVSHYTRAVLDWLQPGGVSGYSRVWVSF